MKGALKEMNKILSITTIIAVVILLVGGTSQADTRKAWNNAKDGTQGSDYYGEVKGQKAPKKKAAPAPMVNTGNLKRGLKPMTVGGRTFLVSSKNSHFAQAMIAKYSKIKPNEKLAKSSPPNKEKNKKAETPVKYKETELTPGKPTVAMAK